MAAAALVRPVTAADHDGVMDLLRLRHDEMGIGTYDPDSAAETLRAAVTRSAPIFAGVIVGSNGPEATIGLAVAKFWDEREEHLQALWDYVHPLYRETEHAQKLQRFARLAAERCGFPLIMGGPIRAGAEGKVHAYCKHMRPAGAFFLYDGPDMPRGTKKQREERADLLTKVFAGGAK